MFLEALVIATQLDNARTDTDLYSLECMAPDSLVVVIKDLVEPFPLAVNSKSFVRATSINEGLSSNSVVVAEDTNPTLANGEGGVGAGTLVGSSTGQWNVLVSKSSTGVEKYSLDVKCFNPSGTYEPIRW